MKPHKGKSITFSIRLFRYVILISVVILAILNGWIIYHSLMESNLNQSTTAKQDAFKKNASNAFIINKAANVLKPEFSKDLEVYLIALNHSVKIINLPFSLSQNVIDQCLNIKTKGSLINHQHSLEIHFPSVLSAMSSSSKSSFRPLCTDDTNHIDNNNNNNNNNGGNDRRNGMNRDRKLLSSLPPLFYYIEAYPYHAIYCTYKKNDKEDWTKRDPYWLSVADYLYSSIPEFMTNVGMDFIAPASHPLSGPYIIHPYTMSYLHHITFLRTDFDVSGSNYKDIIVPYFATESLINKTTTSSSSSSAIVSLRTNTNIKTRRMIQEEVIDFMLLQQKETFLYFSGGDSPTGGYRYFFGTKLNECTQSGQFQSNPSWKHLKIEYSMNLISNQEYLEKMSSSLFCLCIRGDTKSMRRIYTAIARGCIPVIISDWIELPFEGMIDYSHFMIQFPENIVYNMIFLVDYLTNLAVQNHGQSIKRMQASLAQASGLLLYPVISTELSTFLVEKSQNNNNRLRSYYASVINEEQTDNNDNSSNSSNPFNSRKSAHYSQTTFPLLNPVTLVLIEALIRRRNYCTHFTATLLNNNGTTNAFTANLDSSQFSTMPMCQNLMRRLELARLSLLNN